MRCRFIKPQERGTEASKWYAAGLEGVYGFPVMGRLFFGGQSAVVDVDKTVYGKLRFLTDHLPHQIGMSFCNHSSNRESWHTPPLACYNTITGYHAFKLRCIDTESKPYVSYSQKEVLAPS